MSEPLNAAGPGHLDRALAPNAPSAPKPPKGTAGVRHSEGHEGLRPFPASHEEMTPEDRAALRDWLGHRAAYIRLRVAALKAAALSDLGSDLSLDPGNAALGVAHIEYLSNEALLAIQEWEAAAATDLVVRGLLTEAAEEWLLSFAGSWFPGLHYLEMLWSDVEWALSQLRTVSAVGESEAGRG